MRFLCPFDEQILQRLVAISSASTVCLSFCSSAIYLFVAQSTPQTVSKIGSVQVERILRLIF